MMVIPVSQHKLIKIRKVNRRHLTALALYCSTVASITNAVGSMTNCWLYTSEVLKYYVLPNNTQSLDDLMGNQPVFFKNASLGPWQYCWLDPVNDFHCQPVEYLVDDDPSDVTTGVQQSTRRSFLFMMSGMLLDMAGLSVAFVCYCLPNPYRSLFVSTVIHINAGIANFLCIIVYMSAVSKEVGNKIYPASEMDDPLFHYQYGFSFILLKASFLLTEMAALFSIVVYMAKRDERTFNRYKLRSLLNSHKSYQNEMSEMEQVVARENSYHHARFNKPRGSASSAAPSLDVLVRRSPPPPPALPPLAEAAHEAFRGFVVGGYAPTNGAAMAPIPKNRTIYQQ